MALAQPEHPPPQFCTAELTAVETAAAGHFSTVKVTVRIISLSGHTQEKSDGCRVGFFRKIHTISLRCSLGAGGGENFRLYFLAVF